MPCNFISQLSKLRKQSAESVENTNSFDRFKQYLHVERTVEEELKDLLRDINSRQDKCLVLLCGSAGDGKSHLMSYLKNYDTENLLNGYVLYNDATESSEPTKSAIETLAEKLESFNDDQYQNKDHRKMILAVNLGTLNNFIDSEYGTGYSKLKEYVYDNGILSGYRHETGYVTDSVFQHVSFSDYQVFSIGENGIETTYLENLFSKIFTPSDDNPFYMEYVNSQDCPLSKRCPVRHNYEFLLDSERQKAIIRRIVETVIMDKTIVSTREVLNLIYDLLVHPDFNKNKVVVATSDIEYLTNYLHWTTPMLLDEYNDRSTVLDASHNHDILKKRNAESDEQATRFHSMENIEEVFRRATEDTPYIILENLTDISNLGGIKPELKKLVYRFIVRLQKLKGLPNDTESRFDQYIRYLYYQNCGKEKNLQELYKLTQKAVFGWDGNFGGDYICIDDTNEQFWVLEELKFKPSISTSKKKKLNYIQRFSPVLTVRFRKESQMPGEGIEVRIDYSLFELLSDMKEGYRPTVQDKNIHTDFVSFVKQMTEYGNKNERVTIVPKDNNKEYKCVFEGTDFGYEFKVIE